jgi:hypothetical protein
LGYCNPLTTLAQFQHTGYIERIKKAGARARRILDPGFDRDSVTLRRVELSDTEQDEALVPTSSGEAWPCVHESLYCTSRLDDEDNPLRNAGVFTQKEAVREYIRSLEEQRVTVQELRQLYSEKLQRLYTQFYQSSDQAKEKGKKVSGGFKSRVLNLFLKLHSPTPSFRAPRSRSPS